MSDFIKAMAASSSGMQAQAARLRITTENIANADTPGYRRKVVPFEQVFDHDTGVNRVATGRMYLDQGELEDVFDPSHPMASPDGFYQSSNVSLIVEVADAREAQRSYEANLRAFDQARKMTSSLLELLRR